MKLQDLLLRFLRYFNIFTRMEARVAGLETRYASVCDEIGRVRDERDKWRRHSVESGNNLAELRKQLEDTEASLNSEIANLREANQELTTDKLLLEERLSAALDDKERLWEQMQTALDSERNALRSQVNHAVQKSGGGIPYPDAHALPANAVHKPQEPGPIGRRGRVLPSQLASQAARKFVMEELIPSQESSQ